MSPTPTMRTSLLTEDDGRKEFDRLLAFLKQQPELRPRFDEADYYLCANAAAGTNFLVPAPPPPRQYLCPCGLPMHLSVVTMDYVCERQHRISYVARHFGSEHG